jgi:hypothetical protein
MLDAEAVPQSWTTQFHIGLRMVLYRSSLLLNESCDFCRSTRLFARQRLVKQVPELLSNNNVGDTNALTDRQTAHAEKKAIADRRINIYV